MGRGSREFVRSRIRLELDERWVVCFLLGVPTHHFHADDLRCGRDRRRGHELSAPERHVLLDAARDSSGRGSWSHGCNKEFPCASPQTDAQRSVGTIRGNPAFSFSVRPVVDGKYPHMSGNISNV